MLCYCRVLLVCAVLKTLHVEKDFITAEECRRIGEAGFWWDDELAHTIALNQPGMVKLVMNVLEEYKEKLWYNIVANRIKGKHTVWALCFAVLNFRGLIMFAAS